MSKRSYCAHCHYPASTCICGSLTTINTNIVISILQDPTETNHAKNTARLAALIIPEIEIHIGECPVDFVDVIKRVSEYDKTLLVYPSHDSLELIPDAKPVQCNHVILLDGTWRKAKKLWLNNPWLHKLNAVKLNLDSGSQYSIRKSPTPSSLSTLEALAYTLNAIEAAPIAPFMNVLKAMQIHWQKNQPS